MISLISELVYLMIEFVSSLEGFDELVEEVSHLSMLQQSFLATTTLMYRFGDRWQETFPPRWIQMSDRLPIKLCHLSIWWQYFYCGLLVYQRRFSLLDYSLNLPAGRCLLQEGWICVCPSFIFWSQYCLSEQLDKLKDSPVVIQPPEAVFPALL